MFRILAADAIQPALSSDKLAITAHLFYRSTNLHYIFEANSLLIGPNKRIYVCLHQ